MDATHGLTAERLAEIREDLYFWIPSDGAGRESLDALLDEVEQLRGEVSALTIDLARAHEELRQGWPKMARDANAAAIEQWNRADAAEAEAGRLRAQVATAWDEGHASHDLTPDEWVNPYRDASGPE